MALAGASRSFNSTLPNTGKLGKTHESKTHLDTKAILVYSNHFLVHQDVLSGVGHLRDVTANQQRSFHQGPQTEVGLSFGLRHSIANLQKKSRRHKGYAKVVK